MFGKGKVQVKAVEAPRVVYENGKYYEVKEQVAVPMVEETLQPQQAAPIPQVTAPASIPQPRQATALTKKSALGWCVASILGGVLLSIVYLIQVGVI